MGVGLPERVYVGQEGAGEGAVGRLDDDEVSVEFLALPLGLEMGGFAGVSGNVNSDDVVLVDRYGRGECKGLASLHTEVRDGHHGANADFGGGHGSFGLPGDLKAVVVGADEAHD